MTVEVDTQKDDNSENSNEPKVESPEQDCSDCDCSEKIKATRKDLQISRRLFHMGNGFVFATAYAITFSHQQIVYFCGTIACLVYVLDQIRVAYPEKVKKLDGISKYILRAEEQLKESAAVPYIMANLLTILTFPKTIAICAIYTLAFADPMSAIIGIRFGRTRIVQHKSLEGSLAFFLTTFLVIITVFNLAGNNGWELWPMAFSVAFIASCFEMIPLKIDDNLTIPLFTAFILWMFCAILGIAA